MTNNPRFESAKAICEEYGYVVVPKDRRKFLKLNCAVSFRNLEWAKDREGLLSYLRSKMARDFITELLVSGAVLFSEEDREEHKILRGDMCVIMPKPEEPADG